MSSSVALSSSSGTTLVCRLTYSIVSSANAEQWIVTFMIVLLVEVVRHRRWGRCGRRWCESCSVGVGLAGAARRASGGLDAGGLLPSAVRCRGALPSWLGGHHCGQGRPPHHMSHRVALPLLKQLLDALPLLSHEFADMYRHQPGDL